MQGITIVITPRIKSSQEQNNSGSLKILLRHHRLRPEVLGGFYLLQTVLLTPPHLPCQSPSYFMIDAYFCLETETEEL